MPKTIPTTIGPNPTDRRVLLLEQLLNVSRPHAVGVVVMSWAWLHAEQTEGIVPGLPSMLDSVVDIPGAGQALVDAGLVGVSPDGLVLPLELRRQVERVTRADESPDDRRRRKDAERKAKSRLKQRLTKPASKPSPSPTGADTGPKWKPSRLGTVDGYAVMLLWSRAGVPFYKLAGASPKEWTGTVTNQDNPSLADAMVSLHAAMKREDGKGLGSGDTFRPSLQAMVTAAERYRQEREETAAAAARRDEGNRALAEASAEDHDDIDHEPAERDMSRPCPHVTADTVTCPHGCPQSGHNPVDASPYERQDLDSESCPHECPQSCHNAAPSSSSSVPAGNDESKNTTTTSSVTPRQRDHEDDILDRFLDARKPRKFAASAEPTESEQRYRWRKMADRFAAGLKLTTDQVFELWRTDKPGLRTLLLAAGIDPNTGERLNAEVPGEAAQARADIDTTTEPVVYHEPAAVGVDARGETEFDSAHESLHEALRQLGIPSPVTPAPPAEDDAFVSVATGV